jgi:hypothetical protein
MLLLLTDQRPQWQQQRGLDRTAGRAAYQALNIASTVFANLRGFQNHLRTPWASSLATCNGQFLI